MILKLIKTKSNFKLLFSLILSLCLLSCSDDNETPQKQMVLGNKTYDLSNAKIYLNGEENYSNSTDNYKYRNYFITDGTLVSGNGWDLNNYTGATYYFGLQILVPQTSNFTTGNYQSYLNYSEVPKNGKGIYLYGEDQAVPSSYYESKANISSQYKIEGGLELGQTIKINYNGELLYWINDPTNGWTETTTNSKLFYSGKIISK